MSERSSILVGAAGPLTSQDEHMEMRPPAEPTRTLTTKLAVARFAQTTTRTVEHWMKKGVIPFIRIGRLVRFDLAEVEAALRNPKARF
ncbi:MAG: helix-turn-helix domain-containing protein [Verrucomicrobia bacterium]|nr:helix-turn-helix domain-containing protein [Verrucomicrobiota bacterium]